MVPSVSFAHRLTELAYRRKGLAHAALSAFLHYALTCVLLSDSVLMARISATNTASIRLLETLGFEQVKEPNYFNEIEMRFRGDQTVLGEPGVQVHHPEIAPMHHHQMDGICGGPQ